MDYTTLGHTGIRVSVAGLGCGGNSRLGLGRGKTPAECADLVRDAIAQGVNFLDTAEAYGTEEIVGDALLTLDRSDVVISSKCRIRMAGERLTAEAVIESLEASLGRLRTDVIDVFHLHAVAPADYDYARDEIAPALLRAREAGKIKHIGITETGPNDPTEEMLQRAIDEDPWEVIMLAYSMMNQGARKNIFPTTQRRGIGTLLMFVVRNIFSQPDRLRAELKALAEAGQIDSSFANAAEPLDFLTKNGDAKSVTEAAYRYVRHTPGVDVVLFGTGSKDHLRDNIAAINAPPLSQGSIDTLNAAFGALTGVGLDLPDHVADARAKQ